MKRVAPAVFGILAIITGIGFFSATAPACFGLLSHLGEFAQGMYSPEPISDTVFGLFIFIAGVLVLLADSFGETTGEENREGPAD